MERKKANVDGSFNTTKSWYSCQITIGTGPKNGKKIRKTFSGKTKHEALKKKDDYINSFKDGSFIETDALRRNYKEWLQTHKGCLPF